MLPGACPRPSEGAREGARVVTGGKRSKAEPALAGSGWQSRLWLRVATVSHGRRAAAAKFSVKFN